MYLKSSTDFRRLYSVLYDEPSMLPKESDLLDSGFAILHRSANSACKRL